MRPRKRFPYPMAVAMEFPFAPDVLFHVPVQVLEVFDVPGASFFIHKALGFERGRDNFETPQGGCFYERKRAYTVTEVTTGTSARTVTGLRLLEAVEFLKADMKVKAGTFVQNARSKDPNPAFSWNFLLDAAQKMQVRRSIHFGIKLGKHFTLKALYKGREMAGA